MTQPVAGQPFSSLFGPVLVAVLQIPEFMELQLHADLLIAMVYFGTF